MFFSPLSRPGTPWAIMFFEIMGFVLLGFIAYILLTCTHVSVKMILPSTDGMCICFGKPEASLISKYYKQGENRGRVTCPRSHRLLMSDSDLKPGRFADFQVISTATPTPAPPLLLCFLSLFTSTFSKEASGGRFQLYRCILSAYTLPVHHAVIWSNVIFVMETSDRSVFPLKHPFLAHLPFVIMYGLMISYCLSNALSSSAAHWMRTGAGLGSFSFFSSLLFSSSHSSLVPSAQCPAHQSHSINICWIHLIKIASIEKT